MSSTRRTALVLLLCALCAVLAPSAAEQREGHSGHSDSLHPGGSGSAQRFHRFRAQPPQPSAGDSKDAGSGEAKPPAFRFPWEDETDLYGDYDLDKVRDKDTLTLDARDLAPAKPEPQHKRSIMDDFPEFPMRVPVEITPGLSDLIEQQGVYFWNPSNREKGNLNHAGWDKIEAPAGGPIKLKPRGKEPASIPPFDVERPADADPLPPRSPPSNPDDDEMLKKLGSKKGQHIILSPSKLPPPTRDWILTRFAGDGGKALHCHSLDETRAYLNFKGVDKDLPTGVKLFVTAYRNVEGIKRKVKRNDFMEALRRVKEAQNKKVEIPKFRDFLARLAKRLGMDPRPFQRKEHSEESESVGALLKAMAESSSGRARGRRGRESSESSRSRSSRSSESSRSRSSRSESVRRILSQLSELSRAESSRLSEESSEESSSLSLFSHRSASSAARRLLSLGTVMLEVAEPGDLEISSSLQSLLTDGWELDKNYNVKGDSSQRVMDADKAKGNEMSENAEAAGENSNATMANAEGESADWSEIFKRASALDQELNKKLKLKSARAVKAEESSEEGQGTRRPPPTDLTQYPEGFYYFWMHGKPNNYGNPKSCYDPLLPYEKSIDMVGPDSQEVRWGCTPFRIMAIDLQEAVKCAIDAVGLDTWQEIEPDLIHHLSFEAMRRSPKDFKLLYQRKIAYLDEIEARARMRGVNLQLPNDTSSILAECFRDEQRPLQCAPSLQGSVGMMGHGLWDHGDEWIDNAYRNIKDCHVPEGCARLVSERLMHFNLKVHQRSIPEFNNVTVPDWQRQCRMGGDPVLSDNHGDTAWYNSVTSGNDLLTASCMYSGLKQLCMELPECCPNIAVHLACKRDPKSKRCDDICIDRSGVKLARKIKK